MKVKASLAGGQKHIETYSLKDLEAVPTLLKILIRVHSNSERDRN